MCVVRGTSSLLGASATFCSPSRLFADYYARINNRFVSNLVLHVFHVLYCVRSADISLSMSLSRFDLENIHIVKDI